MQRIGTSTGVRKRIKLNMFKKKYRGPRVSKDPPKWMLALFSCLCCCCMKKHVQD